MIQASSSSINMATPKVTAVDLARFILARVGDMPHLKLQKLLYYVEAWHLAIIGDSIIDEHFKAWMHGPVCVDVWHKFKDSGGQTLTNSISLPDSQHKDAIDKIYNSEATKEQISLIEDVLKEYGSLDAYELEGLTHSERPWKEARGNTPPDQA